MKKEGEKSDIDKKLEGLWCDFCGISHSGICKKLIPKIILEAEKRTLLKLK